MAISIEGFELVQSLRDGNSELFEEVVREYRPELLRHARRKMHNDAAAEDVVQETFARAFHALGRLRDDSNIRPWLHHICANVCIDEANRRLRESDKVTRLHLDPLSSRELAPGVEDQLGLTVDDTPLQMALDSLSPEHRHALVLRFVDELEYDELAARAGISEQNARARVSRARSMMRLALNGAAAIPLFIYGLVRRTPRAAAALDRAEALPASANAVSATASVGHLSRIATAVAPAVEAAGAVAAAAPTAAPVLAKVAVGVGLVATATFATTGSESPAQRAAFTERPAAVVATVADDAAATVPAADPADPVSADLAAVAGSATIDSVVSATSVVVQPTTEDATAAAPGASTAPAGAGTAPASTAPVTTAAPTTTVVGATGEIAVRSLAVTAAGPRLDLSGPATLTIGDRTIEGRLSGRVSIATAADRNGRHRVDGTLTVSFEGGSVQVRLAGFATVEPADDDEGTPTDTTIAGDAPATTTPEAVAPGDQDGGSATMSASPTDSVIADGPAMTDTAVTPSSAAPRASAAAASVPVYRLSGRFTTVGSGAGLLSSGSFGGRLSSTELTMMFGS